MSVITRPSKAKPKNKIKSMPKKPVTTSGPKEAARARQSANRGLHKATGSTLTTKLNDEKIQKVQKIKPEHRSSLKRDTASLNKFKADATKRDMKDINRARKADMSSAKPKASVKARGVGLAGVAISSGQAGLELGRALQTLHKASKTRSTRDDNSYSSFTYSTTGKMSGSDSRILDRVKKGMKK